MSDLAPFVAATLRDKIVDDLKTENEKLREELARVADRQLAVQVTGPNGAPVYYETSLKRGAYCEHLGGKCWRVEFDETAAIPLHAISNLEIRVGGMVVQQFTQTTFQALSMSESLSGGGGGGGGGVTHRGGGGDNEPRMYEIVFLISQSSPVDVGFGRFGPMRPSEFREVGSGPHKMRDLVRLCESGLARDLSMTSICFLKSKISGSMALLENMGVPTAGGGGTV